MRHRIPGTGLRRALAPALVALLLAACASTTVVREEPAPRPIHTAQRPGGAPSAPATRGPSHIVQAGETLYGIAFRNSLDWREIARWNGIGEPYLIQPGQVLSLGPPRAAAPSATVVAPRAAAAPAPAIASGPPPMPRGPAAAPPQGTTPPVVRPTQPVPVVAPAPVAAAVPAPAASVPASTPTGPAGTSAFRAGQWQWPTQGQVISRYAEGDKARQGIAIAGTAGQPVRAAAAGTVVYSGAGLVGYGELIIIKHSDEWLSAYGHNRRRLVAEGASISAGQQIAELGRTGTSRDMLHFEIRRNGKPVDPAPLLPRR